MLCCESFFDLLEHLDSGEHLPLKLLVLPTTLVDIWVCSDQLVELCKPTKEDVCVLLRADCATVVLVVSRDACLLCHREQDVSLVKARLLFTPAPNILALFCEIVDETR